MFDAAKVLVQSQVIKIPIDDNAILEPMSVFFLVMTWLPNPVLEPTVHCASTPSESEL